MKQRQKGFVYILSNPEYPGKFKIGKTKDNPIIRAKTLSKQTGAIGEFKVEWSKEVPDMHIAEYILHYKFSKYHYEKEFFKFKLEDIKPLAKKILDEFFFDEYKEENLIKAKLKMREAKEKLKNLG